MPNIILIFSLFQLFGFACVDVFSKKTNTRILILFFNSDNRGPFLFLILVCGLCYWIKFHSLICSIAWFLKLARQRIFRHVCISDCWVLRESLLILQVSAFAVFVFYLSKLSFQMAQ